ncbi:hypothetical protein ACFLYJ_02175 [Candidatus Cloacimonadota bacterium]
MLKKHRYTGINLSTIRLFIIFLGIFIIWNLTMITARSFNLRTNLIYLFFWATVSIFELYLVAKILFTILSDKKKHSDIFYITMSILAIPIILAAILSYTHRSYNPINTTDFYNIILLLLGTVIILRKLLSNEMFLQNIEAFFIFSGFALYFCLHILASNTFSLGFLDNWNFGQNATIVSLIYWLGSIFFIWKIRSKHSF